MSNRKLHKALKNQKEKTQQVILEIYGSLGIPLGGRKLTDVPDRPSYVYVRLRDNQNEVVQAFNNKVTSSYNLPVILHREGTRYVVDGVNTQRYQSNWNNSAAYLPRHGTNHSFYDGGGGDVTWIYSRQIMPYLIYPNSTTTGTYLNMSPHTYLDINNQWKVVGGTGTPSILQYIPTGGNDAIMGLMYLDALTGNPKLLINSGTPFSNLLTGTGDIYPYIPVPNINTQIPLAAVRLSSGTNSINWDNLYDVRQWLRVSASGSSSGGGGGGIDTIGFAGLADGLAIGTGTILNVHGAAFTRSGTVFDLNITGSAGSVTVPVSGTMVIQNNGYPLGSVPILNFTNGLSASISGSVAQIVATGTSIYVRTAPPISLSSVTGSYWVTQERVFASGSLALFNQGHALIPAIDYLEQFPASGTFQYISTPPTGTYNLAVYGVPVAGGNTGGGSGGGGRTLIQSQMPSGTTSVTFSSIPQTYKILILEVFVRSTSVANGVDGHLQFNGDTTAGNYLYALYRTNQTGVANETGANFKIATTTIPAASSPTSQFSNGKVTIPEYTNTSIFKTCSQQWGGVYDNSSVFLQQQIGQFNWKNTAAITSLVFALSAGNFLNGSVINLYGE